MFNKESSEYLHLFITINDKKIYLNVHGNSRYEISQMLGKKFRLKKYPDMEWSVNDIMAEAKITSNIPIGMIVGGLIGILGGGIGLIVGMFLGYMLGESEDKKIEKYINNFNYQKINIE